MTRGTEIHGFWLSLWIHRRILLSWDLPAAVVVGAAAGLFLKDATLDESLRVFLVVEAQVLAGLLGVIIAGLAITVAFLHRDFVAVLARTKTGVAGDFFPFWLVAALSATTVLVAGASVLLIQQTTPLQDRMIAIACSFLGSYSLFSTMNLVGFIVLQGNNRAHQILREQTQADDPQ